MLNGDLCHEKVPNFGQSAIAQNDSPAVAILFSFSVCLKGLHRYLIQVLVS